MKDSTLVTSVEDFPLAFQLRETDFHHQKLEVVGTDSLLSLALLILQSHKNSTMRCPQVVLLPQHSDCVQLMSNLHFFDPNLPVHVLTGFDLNPYQNLYPNPKHIAQRIHWLYRAQQATGFEIFIGSLDSFLQKTLPPESLLNQTHFFSKNDEWPSELIARLETLGYIQSPLVEDVGQFAIRGGIVDIFSPAHSHPIRIELFGDIIESLREFDENTQRSLSSVDQLVITPVRECFFLSDEDFIQVTQKLRESLQNRDLITNPMAQNYLKSLSQGKYFQGLEYLLPYFYDSLSQPLEFFMNEFVLWKFKSLELFQRSDQFLSEIKDDYIAANHQPLYPQYDQIYFHLESLSSPPHTRQIGINKIHIQDGVDAGPTIDFRSSPLSEFQKQCQKMIQQPQEFSQFIEEKLTDWRESHVVIITCTLKRHEQQLQSLFENTSFQLLPVEDNDYHWDTHVKAARENKSLVLLVNKKLSESLKLNEHKYIFLREEDFFGNRSYRKNTSSQKEFQKRAHALSFGDLKPDDFVVHKMHGVGKYLGLMLMPINGVQSEFIQIQYKDKDKLYLPVYRIGQVQKYSGPQSPHLIDKLGGTSWKKTQIKVRAQIKDLASELLSLYAKRSQSARPAYPEPDNEYYRFEDGFIYEETDDQLKAISDVLGDLTSEKPMDRLICGDVGFGKTEIAMRATFKVAHDGRQVAIIAPTTILTFQHFENFKKRFHGWPIKIEVLNRFVSPKKSKEVVQRIKEGDVDIVIGTHRLFSKDIVFKDLGLLVIDEEQKFGVKHKEKIRKLRVSVDTLTLSATPIPRTLNLSLMGIRDLSLIQTAPVDRLPTRTFITRFDKDTIKKAVTSEISRGGQVFFLHNRVHSIYALEEELKSFLPNVKIAVAHGQMPEHQLEKTMLSFFNHEIDLLLCTTIIESGMDIPRANTMFIDNAHQFGLSQLYQLRGRVGRSKQRAYCYLLIPPNKVLDSVSQERLKVIQENTALGSGIQVAQYDLELRGAGDILGKDQSGQINAVGYELYLELLDEAIKNLKGEPVEDLVEPEINLRVPAYIPDEYISDIRIRLSYYKAMSDIQNPSELDEIEEELVDQFGKLPDPVVNLLGIMLIRKICRDLSIRDLSHGTSNLSLAFTEKTPLTVNKVLALTGRPNKKYTLTPDSRLIVRIKEITWPRVYEELNYLKTLC